MKKIIIYGLLFITFSILSVYIGIKNENVILGVSLFGTALISFFFTFMPFFKSEILQLKNKKTAISDITFTNMCCDIKKVFSLLDQCRILQVVGYEEKCGKSALVKKICDIINIPKERKQYINKCIKYNSALYFDLDKSDEEKIVKAISGLKINKKTLFIFDHVKDLTFVKSQCLRYNFDLIYILSPDKTVDNNIHTISRFDLEHVKQLHQKILYVYPLVGEITKSEIEVVHKLTDGNINKIVNLLSNRQYISWVKNIDVSKQTDYECDLQKIEIELFCGHYKCAKNKLIEFSSKYEKMFDINNHLNFKYILIKSDCEHLLNNYSDAVSILSTLNPAIEYNKNYILEVRLAHYYKHLWKSEQALEILQNIYEKTSTAILDSFGIFLSQYFIDGTASSNNYPNSLKMFLQYFKEIDSMELSPDCSEYSKKERYNVYYTFYTSKNPDYDYMISLTNKLINEYRQSGNRLLANAYVLQGEINRIFKKYDLAEINYEQSLLVTDDKNILGQVHLIRHYLISICHKKFKYKLPKYTKQDLIELCENNQYNSILFSLINSVDLKDLNSSKIIDNFEKRLMIIL